MIVLYILNALTLINAIVITKKIYFDYKNADKILVIFTIYIAQIILFILALGIPGLLSLKNLLIPVILFSAVILVALRKNISLTFFFNSRSIRDFIFWVSGHKMLAVSISFFLGFSIVKIFQNLINPTFLWGSLIYHFTAPVEWLKTGNLIHPPIVFGNPSLAYIAKNAEFLFLWFMLPLKNAFIADVVSYLFYIAGAIACFSIIRKFGISREIALLGGVLFSLTPQYFKHLLFNGNDIIVASSFLIALNFILLLKERVAIKCIVLSGIACGLLWGSKSTAMIWAPLLALLVLYYNIIRYREIRFTKLFSLLVIFTCLVIVFGGFTYIRNFIETGNPFYPVSYHLLGLEFNGPIEFSNIRDNINLLNVDLEEMLFHQSFGLNFIILAFPALFLALPISLIKSKFRISLDLAYLLILPLAMLIIFYAKCPHHTPSYLYHAIAMGTILGIYTLKTLRLPDKIVKTTLFLLIIASTVELTGHLMLFYSLVISALLFVCLFLAGVSWKYCKISGVILLAVFLIALPFLETYHELTKYKNYNKTFPWEKELIKTWNWIYENTLDKPKNIAYAGSAAVFPLYGKDFKNNVFYVSVNEKEAYLTNFSKYYHLHDSYKEWLDLMRQKGCLRENANPRVWLKNLKEKNTDLLFIMSTDDFKTFPVEDKWAKQYGYIFKPLLENKRVHLYEVIK